MSNTVTITVGHWNKICHELKLDQWGHHNDRKSAFQDYFGCTTTWRSRLDDWEGDVNNRLDPIMILKFNDPKEAVLFSLRWTG